MIVKQRMTTTTTMHIQCAATPTSLHILAATRETPTQYNSVCHFVDQILGSVFSNAHSDCALIFWLACFQSLIALYESFENRSDFNKITNNCSILLLQWPSVSFLNSLPDELSYYIQHFSSDPLLSVKHLVIKLTQKNVSSKVTDVCSGKVRL